jgi:ubiquinone/menaquinone biosynthesis C-methylase UbiE
MTGTLARYDGHSDWYEDWNRPGAERTAERVLKLLGPGDGLCLDLGCGTGHYLEALSGSGRMVVGLDRSADQLRYAATRWPNVVQGDAASLPFPDGAFSAVVTIWISTDVDNFADVLGEAVRVLRPGGLVIFHGAHPCFNGPHVQWTEDGGVLAHSSYRHAGWHAEAPYWGEFIRRRVGMRHHPLAELVNAFIDAGLRLERMAESGDRAVPTAIGIRARKS